MNRKHKRHAFPVDSALALAECFARRTPIDFPAYGDLEIEDDDDPSTIADSASGENPFRERGDERCLVCEACLPAVAGSERYVYDLISAIVARGIAAVVLDMCEEHQACYLIRIGEVLRKLLAEERGGEER